MSTNNEHRDPALAECVRAAMNNLRLVEEELARDRKSMFTTWAEDDAVERERDALKDEVAELKLVVNRLGCERDTIADMLARHPLPERGTLPGTRITKHDFLLLMREAACRLRHDEAHGGWLVRAMQVVNEIEGSDDDPLDYAR